MQRPQRYVPIPETDLLTFLFANISEFGNKPLYIDADNAENVLTGLDTLRLVRRLIAGFRRSGVKPGDAVCIVSFNDILYTPIYLSVIGVGARSVGANPGYTGDELRHLFSITNTRYVIVQQQLMTNVLPVAIDCGIPASNVYILSDRKVDTSRGESHRPRHWTALLESGERDWIRFDSNQSSRETVAALMLTSGTTGLPKAAAISHYALIAQSMILEDSKEKAYDIRRLIFLPLFHAFAIPLAHLAPLREGHTTTVMRRFRSASFYENISRFRITETAIVPPIVMELLKASTDERRSLSGLRFVWCAGAPLAETIHADLSAVLHSDAIFVQVWGMTEAGWITTTQYPERGLAGSVGRLLPNTEAIVVNSVNPTLDENVACTLGEILVRGPSVMSGYLSDAIATKDAFRDGWLRTGDVGNCQDGHWFITDRAKDIIKVNAWQVSPSELESVLLSHPGIVDAAVVGVEDSSVGEVPQAFVVRKAAYVQSLTVDDIFQHVGKRLAKYKQLAGGVRFVHAIPRNLSGKILRKRLCAEYVEER